MTTGRSEAQGLDKIRLVVFDMAGTTVNDEDSVNRCLREALAAAGLDVTAEQVNAVMGIYKPTAIRMLIEESSQKDRLAGQVDAIHDDFVERSVRFYQQDPSVHEVAGASNVFQTLQAAGILVALDTGFNRRITDVILGRLGWSNNPLIAATITSDEVARGRPHPDMIRALMARLGVVDSRSVAKVGDTPVDLAEGVEAECGLVIGVTEGTHSREQLEPHPHTHLIGSVVDLPGLLGL